MPVFSPVLHYNAVQGDMVGGAFWDMRATGLRLNSPLAEQAQGPPLDPAEMGMVDAACLVYRASSRAYRSLAERSWGAQAFAIRWPRNVNAICDQPGLRQGPILCPSILHQWIAESRRVRLTASRKASQLTKDRRR